MMGMASGVIGKDPRDIQELWQTGAFDEGR